MSASVTHAEPYTFVTKWGSQGSSDGQFYLITYIAVDSSGHVYAADIWNNRIQKFDSNGNFITKWYSYTPHGVDFDYVGNFYVTAEYYPLINKYDSTGTLIKNWGSYGTGDGQTDHPCGIAVDSSDNVYVADWYNHRIQKFDSNGNFITKWGSYGSGDGQLDSPQDIDVDSSGFVYVSEIGTHRIQKFDSNGNFITKWGSFGSGDGQFNNPFGVTVDSNGYVYVADAFNHRIQVFDSNGNFITKWGSYGSGDGQFIEPRKVAIDSSGKVYVADSGNENIQVFVKEEKSTPTITWDNPADITYGTPLGEAQLNAVAKDPVTGATVDGVYTYILADGTPIVSGVTVLDAGTHTLHVDFTPSDPATYNTESADVIINVLIPPPTINSIAVPLDPVQVSTSITTSASVTYLGDLNSLTVEWNWGDGSVSQSQGSSNFESSHVYNSADIYTVTFTVKDNNGGIDTQQASNYVVVYNPEGGFVTGGGWINSPAGAYVPDNTLTGKATFGFVSKYQKGATVPTGNTEFQFKVANLNFKSTSYDWLVVAGSKAKYKGTGTINGAGNYGFMLSAVDGAIKGDGIDKFRIKIWDKESNDIIIYDNEVGIAEDAEPSTTIGGGSIVIHKE